ncbi:DNA-directed DNA polymerase [Senna tora]|uniref:DNA-directed DNA polymerase n=1 Tax=Senna tora TaxID=362788 RepID=A0A834TQW9_9FABA|nr:DNA-directed DNA polymerase [Senna tora]
MKEPQKALGLKSRGGGPSLDNMAKDKTLRELVAPPVKQAPLCIVVASNLQAPLELKSSLIYLLPKFRGLTNEDPCSHEEYTKI